MKTKFLAVLVFIVFVAKAQSPYNPLNTPNTYRQADNPNYWQNKAPAGYWQQDVHYNIKANIDETKDMFELPRFPINEKYGEMKRFKTLLKTLPFKYKKIEPEEKYIFDKNNPPKVRISFYEDLYDLNLINCFSNEEDRWRNSKIIKINSNEIKIELAGKFVTERGRINCSLRSNSSFYHWLGIQFVIAEK